MLFVRVSFVSTFLLISSEDGYPVFCLVDLPVSLDEMKGDFFLLVLSRLTDSGVCLSALSILDEFLNGVPFSFL